MSCEKATKKMVVDVPPLTIYIYQKFKKDFLQLEKKKLFFANEMANIIENKKKMLNKN